MKFVSILINALILSIFFINTNAYAEQQIIQHEHQNNLIEQKMDEVLSSSLVETEATSAPALTPLATTSTTTSSSTTFVLVPNFVEQYAMQDLSSHNGGLPFRRLQ